MFSHLSNTTETVEITLHKGIFHANLRFVFFNGTMSRVFDITSYRQSDHKGDIKECKKEGFDIRYPKTFTVLYFLNLYVLKS